MENFSVRVSKDDLAFSAAHFITLGPDQCEGLHGHNYGLTAEVHGPLDENGYLVDFIALHKSLRAIVDELDHRVLLPLEHSAIRVVEGENEVEVRFAERRWIFPKSECCLLPLSNTTAELLARYVGRRLLDALPPQIAQRLSLVRIEIEESAGLCAVCELKNE